MEKERKNKQIGLLGFLSDKKSTFIIVLLLIAGLLLLLLPSTGTSKKTYDNNEARLNEYAASLEAKIAELCSCIKGVSSVKVTVYFDTGFETVYAYNEENKTTSSGTNSEKKYVTVGSGNDESMVLVVEKMPNICGVAIVCRGGGDAYISREIINLISSAYGVPKNKIYVAEGKN